MKSSRKTLLAIGVAALFCFLASSAFAQVKYTIVDLGTLGGSVSVANAIDNDGRVVGRSTLAGDNITRAFLWQEGVMTNLGSLGGSFSSANRINDGDVIGTSELSGDTARHAVLFQNGSVTDISVFPNYLFCAGFGINHRFETFGGCIVDGTRSGPFHAAQFKGGNVIDFGTLGGPTSFAVAANKRGTAVGRTDLPDGSSRSVLFDHGTIVNLGTLPGGSDSFGRAINDRGAVACLSDNGQEFHACLYRHGKTIDLGTLGGGFSDSSAINNRGQVVGTSLTAAGEQHAYLWSKGAMSDLNSSISADSGWTLLTATGINDDGEIAGNGQINGQSRGFLLVPIEQDEDGNAEEEHPR